ncbi:MAG: lysostaphin resistance A-like protein [Candidatus Bathycorpusculaceae bacterium]
MEVQSEWKGKASLACYFALLGGVLAGSIVLGLLLAIARVDYQTLPFPMAFVSVPVNEAAVLGVTLLFARYKGASLERLGLKRVSLKVLAVVSVVAVLLVLLASGIEAVQMIIFGPDPLEEAYLEAVMPRDSLQLAAMIVLFLGVVGPCEELAFRGFIQKGFENSLGKVGGLLLTSALFGLWHSLNTLYAVLPTFVGGLVLGYVWQKTGGNTTALAWMHGVYNTVIALATFFAV